MQTLLQKNYGGSGCESAFYIVDGVGYKVFHDFLSAEACWAKQILCWKNGIGPKVFSSIFSVEIENGNRGGYWQEKSDSKIKWGYITEIVRVSTNYTSAEYEESWEAVYILQGKLKKIFKKDKWGGNDFDIYGDNIGINSDGKFVVIDFGHHLDGYETTGVNGYASVG